MSDLFTPENMQAIKEYIGAGAGGVDAGSQEAFERNHAFVVEKLGASDQLDRDSLQFNRDQRFLDLYPGADFYASGGVRPTVTDEGIRYAGDPAGTIFQATEVPDDDGYYAGGEGH